MTITAYQTGPAAVYLAKFTQTVGAANQTLAIAGNPFLVTVCENKTTGSTDYHIGWSKSVSGVITTITIACDAAITNGTLVVLYVPN